MPDFDDEEEFSELTDARFGRVDLVHAPANGADGWLVMKQADGGPSLLDAGFVRSLIGKQADPGDSVRERATLPNGITLSGSAAEMAAFIHKAAERAAERDAEDVAKEKNDTADRKHKAATGAAMPNGSYPIADVGDLEKAIHAVGRGGSSHDAIRRHIISRARSLGASSKIPDNWNSDGSLKEPVSKEDAVTGAVAKADAGPELDGGVDGLDPTVPLAEPDEMGAGDMTDPGSPAWESIDAATASKWCSILSRARVAVDLLAEREMLEAASGDSDDAGKACDLEDACCAIDFAISVLAPFAVSEQSAADCGEADLMAAIGKAAEALESVPLAAVEGLCAVAKSGRVLSAANEAHIREAAQRLNTVLSSLPQAPATDDGQQVAKGGVPVTATQTDTEAPVAKDAAKPAGEQAPEAAPAQPPAEVAKSALALVYDRDRNLVGVTDSSAIVTRVAKADGDGEKKAMQAVFDQDGDLIGIVDPDAIQPVTGAGGKPAADDAAEAPAADDGDMTPQPPAEAGTPADSVAKGARPEAEKDSITVTQDVLKSIAQDAARTALEAQGAAHAEVVAKMAADSAGLAEQLQAVTARLETVEKQDARPGVFTSGAVPPEGAQPPPRPSLRGQDQGAAAHVDVAKARQRKAEFYAADPADRNRIATEMQTDAIGTLAAIHASGPAPG